MLYRDTSVHGDIEEDLGERRARTLGPFRQVIGNLTRIKAVVVGLDLREYSRRGPENQLFLAVRLEASIKKAKQILRDGGLLPSTEPRVADPTGDGALVFFTSLDHYGKDDFPDVEQCKKCLNSEPDPNLEAEPACSGGNQRRREKEFAYFAEVVDQAMAFVFALNAIISSDNTRNTRRGGPRLDGSSLPAYPVECRFALSYGDVLLRQEEGGTLRCSGGGLITCSRILSSDRGNHFLIHEDLLRELEAHGGLSSICRGQWGHRLHSAMLAESVVKSGKYQFADVFGFHHDGPLLRALGNAYQEPREYHIGSHNVSSINTA